MNIYDILSQARDFDQNVNVVEADNLFWRYASCHMNVARNYTSVCLAAGVKVCQQRRIQAVKLIRLDVSLLDKLFQELPNLHVIYQYRDPRGILASRFANARRLATHRFEKETKILCANMLHDVNVTETLSAAHPGRVIFMKFEDIAMNPAAESERVYSLLGETVPPEVTSWLSSATANENSADRPFHTVRADSTKIPLAWQRTLDSKRIAVVNELCQDFILKMNYTL